MSTSFIDGVEMNIGIFDSGSGGLTVMRALDAALPGSNMIYLGDHANAPYGNKSAEEIYQLTLQNVERLFHENCSLVIIACNTAAACGLRRLQREWLPLFYPDRRVLGVIVPVVEAVTGMQWIADQPPIERMAHHADRAVAVFATQHTVQSRAFAGEIHKRAPHIEVWQQACPDLVHLLETETDEPAIRQVVAMSVASLQTRMAGRQPDICILGCTHYPLVEHLFRRVLPYATQIVSQPEITARSLVTYLSRHPERRIINAGLRRFMTTGDADLASRIASRFYGHAVDFKPWVAQSRAGLSGTL